MHVAATSVLVVVVAAVVGASVMTMTSKNNKNDTGAETVNGISCVSQIYQHCM